METFENNENTEIKQEQSESQEQITEEIKEQEIKKPDDVLILPVSGLEVKMDTTKATGHTLMQARQESNGVATSGVFLIAKLATFNGELKTGFDILDLDAEDVLALEDYYIQKKTYQILTRKKLLQSQK